jgi:hypothetical protein
MPLRIKVELIPRGDERRIQMIGLLEIENTNDHPERPAMGRYRYRMTGPVHGGGSDDWYEGHLDFRRSRGYWALVKEILADVDCEAQPESETT